MTSRRRWTNSVAALALGALLLAGCGSPSSSIVDSTNCHVSVTNLDYVGCNFAGRNLANVDLQSDDLRHADLAHANLDGANLQGALLSGANLAGTLTNSSTVCVNATLGPCTKPGLRAPTSTQSS